MLETVLSSFALPPEIRTFITCRHQTVKTSKRTVD